MAVYTCTVCGKRAPWGDSWSRYSSVALDETCPRAVPAMCSDECRTVAERKIAAGEWQLPVLAKGPGGFSVVREKRGY